MLKVIFLGDIVGNIGRKSVKQAVPDLRKRFSPDFVIVNGENSAGGIGIDIGCAEEILGAGVDLITGGNHSWKRREIFSYMERNPKRIIRPANYPGSAPGAGTARITNGAGRELVVVNLVGRVFMTDLVDCPFATVDSIVNGLGESAPPILLDFHAEATSEKVAFGNYVDGRVSGMFGTHTHVQTADQKILPRGTAYITDVGMCGARDGVIGMKTDSVIERFCTALPARFEVATGATQVNGVFVEIDDSSRKATKIERIQLEG